MNGAVAKVSEESRMHVIFSAQLPMEDMLCSEPLRKPRKQNIVLFSSTKP